MDKLKPDLLNKHAYLSKTIPKKGRISDRRYRTTVKIENDRHLCTTTYGGHGDEVKHDLAKRIVLCWNRCKHMSNEEIEHWLRNPS